MSPRKSLTGYSSPGRRFPALTTSLSGGRERLEREGGSSLSFRAAKTVRELRHDLQPAVPGCEDEDVNGDGTVNVLDLGDLLLAFGMTK